MNRSCKPIHQATEPTRFIVDKLLPKEKQTRSPVSPDMTLQDTELDLEKHLTTPAD